MYYTLADTLGTPFSMSGNADDRPTEEVAFYYNKIAFSYSQTTDGKKF